jgi:hypothetical protein
MRTSTEPLPWPAAADPSVIQDASLDADHVQSRVVSIVTVASAPTAGAVAIELVAVTPHFDELGAVTSMLDDVHAATARQARARQMMSADVSRM